MWFFAFGFLSDVALVCVRRAGYPLHIGHCRSLSVRRRNASNPGTRGPLHELIPEQFWRIKLKSSFYLLFSAIHSPTHGDAHASGQRAHAKYASRPSRIGHVVFNHCDHMTWRHLSLTVGMSSSVLHGQLAMKHKGIKANHE